MKIFLSTGVSHQGYGKKRERCSSKNWILCEEKAYVADRGSGTCACKGWREMNLMELLREKMSEYDENSKSENSVIERLRKHISRDSVRKIANFIEKKARKVTERIGNAEIMLHFVKPWLGV